MKTSSILLIFIPSISAFAPFLSVARNKNKNPSTSTSAIYSVADLKVAFEQNPTKTFLLDVREQDEWTEAHLALATPVPLSKLSSGTWMDNKTGIFSPGTFPIDRFTGVSIMLNTRIWVHSSKMGEDTKAAVDLLTKMGYTNVSALTETFDELAAAGICDVVRGEILQDLAEVS
jgi:rhodanese-related sulfurtransferase